MVPPPWLPKAGASYSGLAGGILAFSEARGRLGSVWRAAAVAAASLVTPYLHSRQQPTMHLVYPHMNMRIDTCPQPTVAPACRAATAVQNPDKFAVFVCSKGKQEYIQLLWLMLDPAGQLIPESGALRTLRACACAGSHAGSHASGHPWEGRMARLHSRPGHQCSGRVLLHFGPLCGAYWSILNLAICA